MTVCKNIDIKKPLTAHQREMLEKLAAAPVAPYDDCPELTAEELKEMRRIADERAADRRKQTVTLRLSPQALKTAKTLGKGYTSVLSRILETALSDSETKTLYIKNRHTVFVCRFLKHIFK